MGNLLQHGFATDIEAGFPKGTNEGELTITEETMVEQMSAAGITTAIDDDTMGTAAATNVASSESIVAYIATQIATADSLQEAFDIGQTITIANTDNQTLAITQNDTTNNPIAVSITNTGSGQGLFINQDGNGYGLNIDNDGTNSTIHCDTTAVANAGIYMAGDGIRTALSTSALLVLRHTNVSSSGTVQYIENAGTGIGLHLDQNGDGLALVIDTEATTVPAIQILADAVHTGVTTNSPFTLRVDHASSSCSPAYIQNDGTGSTLHLDMNGAGKGIDLDKDVTNTSSATNALHIVDTSAVNDAGTYTKSGTTLSITSDVIETSGTITDSSKVVSITQSHVQASGTVLDIVASGTGRPISIVAATASTSMLFQYTNTSQSNAMFQIDMSGASSSGIVFDINSESTGNCIDIDQNGNGISLNIDSEATTQDILNLSAATLTTGKVIDIPDLNSVTTGAAMKVISTSTGLTSGRILEIQHTGDSAHSAQLLYVLSNNPSTTARVISEVVNDNAAATGAIAFKVRQDSTNNGVFIDQNGNGIALNIDSEATTADVINIDATTLTSGEVIDIQNANALTSSNVIFIHSTSTTWTGNAIAIQHLGNSAAGSLFNGLSRNTDTGARTLLQITNDEAAAIGAKCIGIQQDSTNNALFIDMNGNGDCININATGGTSTNNIFDILAPALTTGSVFDCIDLNALTTGKVIEFKSTSTAFTTGRFIDCQHTGNSAHSGQMAYFLSSNNDTTVRQIVRILNNNSAATGAVPLYIDQASTGNGIFIDHNGATGIGLNIDRDSNSASTAWAAQIDSDNAGAGVGGGIDFSSMGVADTKFKFVADATDPTSGGGAATGRIAIDIGGATVYIPYY